MTQPEVPLTLYTIPAKKTRSGYRRAAPYRHVAGVSMGSQEPLWTPRLSRRSAQPESLVVPASMAAKVVTFFASHFATRNPEKSPLYSCMYLRAG